MIEDILLTLGTLPQSLTMVHPLQILTDIIPMEFLIVIVVIATILIVVGIFASSYTVVPPHEAHVVVQGGRGRKLYSSRPDSKGRVNSKYFAVPIVQRRAKLPLRNKQLYIVDIPLRDKDLAKFKCDVTCWINIEDPILASERIGEQQRIRDFTGIEDDIKNLVQAVTRNSSMKMDLVSLMGERLEFSKRIADEVQPSIKEWGVKLVDLECIHFQDTEGYTVIKDLEQRRSAKINSTTRQQVAEQNKLADIAESNATRETEKTRAENEELFKTRQIQRDEKLGTRTQDKEQAIAKAEQEANKQKVESMRTLEVGTADVEKQSTIRRAEGKAGETKTVGEADAEVVRLTGTAEADVTRRKAFAEADGIDKKAEAQKKYQESGAFAIEVIGKAFDTYRDIEIAKFVNLARPLEKADIKVLSTGEEGELFGIPIGAKGGIAMGGMLEGIKEISGFDVGQAIEDVASGVKDFLGKGKKKEEAKKK